MHFLCLDYVEALAECALDAMECYKGIGIGIAYKAEHVYLFVLVYDGYDDAGCLVTVSALAVHKGTGVASVLAYGTYDVVIFLGINGELDVLLAGVYHDIQGKGVHYQCYVAVYHGLPAVPQEIAAAYDDEVEVEEYASDGDVLVLVDDTGNDIPAAAAAAAHEDHAYAYAVQHGTEYAGHGYLLVLTQDTAGKLGVHADYPLADVQIEGKGEHGIQGLEGKLASQLPPGDNKQQTVDDEQGVLHGEACCILDDGCNTGSATCHDLVGQHEDCPAKAVDAHTDVDEEHILDEIENMGVPEATLQIFLVSPDILAMDSLVCHIEGFLSLTVFRPVA